MYKKKRKKNLSSDEEFKEFKDSKYIYIYFKMSSNLGNVDWKAKGRWRAVRRIVTGDDAHRHRPRIELSNINWDSCRIPFIYKQIAAG